jgi:hypothetical protein
MQGQPAQSQSPPWPAIDRPFLRAPIAITALAVALVLMCVCVCVAVFIFGRCLLPSEMYSAMHIQIQWSVGPIVTLRF